jgi:hypothetical protein
VQFAVMQFTDLTTASCGKFDQGEPSGTFPNRCLHVQG